MRLIESKVLTDLYEIRRRINEEIKDMNAEEQTAYFRRNAQAALRNRRARTTPTLGPEERNEPPDEGESLGASQR